MWICTATGSTAAMLAAGGSAWGFARRGGLLKSCSEQITYTRVNSLQYMVRENMKEYGQDSVKAACTGIIGEKKYSEMKIIRVLLAVSFFY
jgi:hypothetical protein